MGAQTQTNRDEARRQEFKDLAYVKECAAAGIDPQRPRYTGGSVGCHSEDADSLVEARGSALDLPSPHERHFPSDFYFDERADPDSDSEGPARTEGEILLALLDRLCPEEITPNAFGALHTRLVVLLWLCHRPAVANLTLRELAGKIGKTPAALSHHAVNLSREFKIRHRAMKSDSARESYAAARLAAIEKGFGSTRNPDWEHDSNGGR